MEHIILQGKKRTYYGFEKRGESYNGDNDVGISYFEKKLKNTNK